MYIYLEITGGPPGISSGPRRVPQILGKTFTGLCTIKFRRVFH